MRICLVSAEHSPHGGIGYALRRQVEVLSERHEVVLIDRPQPREALARISFASEDHLRSAAVLEEIEKAYEGTGGPDLLEVCDYRALGLVALQARAAGHPLLREATVAVRLSATAELVALHDGRGLLPAEQRVGDLEREQFRLADCLFWPGGDILDAYRRYYGQELLPAAVRTGRPFPASPPPRVPELAAEGPLRILYAGRLQRVKGAMDLVDACLRLPADDWELTLIGADTETAGMGQSVRLTIERMCEGDPRVRIEDAVPHEDLQRRFAEHHLLAVPSNFEFCGNVALEAMRAGTPVLATPVGALAEFVGEGGGWLTEDVGAPALGRALARLLDDREEVERARASGEAFEAFRRFTDPERALAAYESLPAPSPAGRPARAGAKVPEEPAVTAVIPYHRAHRYVEEAVGSLLAQTHRNLDVIVVNDGSFEPEDAVLDRLAEGPRVRVVAQLQRGDMMARRLGIRLATGEFVLMFDADNVLEPEFVARALTMFGERPELAYVTCWLRHVGPDGTDLGGGYAPLGNRVLGSADENWDGDTAALVRRRVLDLPDPFPEQQALQGDWLFYRRLRERGEYGAVIPEPLIRYRVHPDSNLRSSDRRLHARSWEEGQDWLRLAAGRWTVQS